LFRIGVEEYEQFLDTNSRVEVLLEKYVSLVNEIDKKPAKSLDSYRRGLFLNVANTCNAMCSYCFAHQGDYGKERAIMSSKTACDAVDFFLNKTPSDVSANLIFLEVNRS
jgi:uncharacterized protein